MCTREQHLLGKGVALLVGLCWLSHLYPRWVGGRAGFILPCSALGVFAEPWGMFNGGKLLLRGD